MMVSPITTTEHSHSSCGLPPSKRAQVPLIAEHNSVWTVSSSSAAAVRGLHDVLQQDYINNGFPLKLICFFNFLFTPLPSPYDGDFPTKPAKVIMRADMRMRANVHH